MKRTVLFFGLVIVAVLFAERAHAAGSTVACDKARAMQLSRDPGLTIVDVRPEAAFAAKHVEGAVNIPVNRVVSANLPKTGTLLLYCTGEGCEVSAQAAQALKAAGYTNASVLEGGLAAWEAKGYPIVQVKTPTVTELDSRIKRLSPRNLHSRLKDPATVILDLRPSTEFGAGHVLGAMNIPLESLPGGMAALDKGKTFVVYDRVRQRSRQAAAQLFQAGFKVEELDGGIQVWIAQKHEMAVGK